jgi:hypothetical protein
MTTNRQGVNRMTSQHRTRVGLVAALAVASLAAAAPAGADPNPAQRLQSSSRPELRALAQEQYYMSHKPAIPAPGHDFRTIDARESARATEAALAQEQYYGSHPSAISTPGRDLRTIDAEPAGSSGFEWDDAAIGAGSALGLVLVLAGGAAAVSRRHRPATS